MEAFLSSLALGLAWAGWEVDTAVAEVRNAARDDLAALDLALERLSNEPGADAATTQRAVELLRSARDETDGLAAPQTDPVVAVRVALEDQVGRSTERLSP